MLLLSAPFPSIRAPIILTPRIYAGTLMYMCFVNFAIVYATYNLFDAGEVLREFHAWLALSALTSVTVISAAVAFSRVPQSHKHTFYEHRTAKEHISKYIWNEKTRAVDHKHRELIDRDGIKAMIAIWYSSPYLPKDKLVEFYGNNWEKWCAEPPYWFDEEFKSMVPRDLLVGVNEKFWGDE